MELLNLLDSSTRAYIGMKCRGIAIKSLLHCHGTGIEVIEVTDVA